MARQSCEVVGAYDFTQAMSLSLEDRMVLCVERVRQKHHDGGTWNLYDIPPVPDSGASDAELNALESVLGMPLPAEYRFFLERWRYLVIDDGCTIWGFDHDGVSVGSPWVSTDHRPEVEYLVIGDYFEFADGDQIMFDLTEPEQPLVAYLHEHGPLYEYFAPTFSLALWRMARPDGS